MTIWNIIYNICRIGCAVCLVVSIAVLVASDIQARKFRRKIEDALKNKEDSDG